MKTWYDLSEKDATKGCLGTLIIFFFFLFSFLYRDKVDRGLEKHGVWTIMNITQKFGAEVRYTFQLNSLTYRGGVKLTKDKAKSGKRFFVLVNPNNLNKHRIKNVVPEWFTLDAPSEGWKKRPTMRELQDMLWEKDAEVLVKESSSDGDIVQNQTNKTGDAIKKSGESGEIDIYDFFFVLFFLLLILIFLCIFLILHRRKKRRYIEENGVWTIMTITETQESTASEYQVDYTFQLNHETFTGIDFFSKEKINDTRNYRFFMMVIPGKEQKQKVYDIVPKWFTLDAPLKGWDKCPTETELREMMRQARLQQSKDKIKKGYEGLERNER